MPQTQKAKLSENLKVLIFGCFRYPFGAASSSLVRHLAKGLKEAGVPVTIVTLGPDLRQNGGCGVNLPFDAQEIPYRSCIGPQPTSFAAKVIAALKGLLRARNTVGNLARDDGFNTVIVYQPTATLYACLSAIPRLGEATIIAHRVEWYEPNVFPFGHADPRYFSDLTGRLWDHKRADGVIAISAFIQNQYANRLPVLKIPAIFDFEGAAAPANAVEAGRPTLVCVSTLKPNDGVDHIIEALRIVRRNGKLWRLAIIGACPDQKNVNNLLEACQNTPELRGAVDARGRLEGMDYLKGLASSTALVLMRKPDVRSEASFPTRLPEYLATGRPVIAANVPDIPSYLVDGEHAHVVPPCRPDLIAERLEAIVRDPTSSKELGERGRRRAAECFDYRGHGRHLAEFLKQVRGARQEPRRV